MTIVEACLLLLLYSFLAVADTGASCYYPNGMPAKSDSPCDPDAETSGCCGSGTFCLDNGLCLGTGILSRGSCTDPNWGALCPQACKDENPGGGMSMSLCSSTVSSKIQYFACGLNSTCENVTRVEGGSSIVLKQQQVAGLGYQRALEVSSTTILQSNLSSNASDAQNATCTAVATSPSPSPRSAAYTAGQMTGVGLGVGLPLLIGLAAAVLTVLIQRKKLRELRATHLGSPNIQQGPHQQFAENPHLVRDLGLHGNLAKSSDRLEVSQLDGGTGRFAVSEMDALRAPQELTGDLVRTS